MKMILKIKIENMEKATADISISGRTNKVELNSAFNYAHYALSKAWDDNFTEGKSIEITNNKNNRTLDEFMKR